MLDYRGITKYRNLAEAPFRGTVNYLASQIHYTVLKADRILSSQVLQHGSWYPVPEAVCTLLPHVLQHGGLPSVHGQGQINKVAHRNGHVDLYRKKKEQNIVYNFVLILQ